MKIKTGDNVRVMAGKHKGKEGKVIQTFPALNKVVVEGVNMTIKHVKARGKQPGQRVSYNAPLRADNVAVVGQDGKVGRVGATFVEKDGKKKKVRVLRVKTRV